MNAITKQLERLFLLRRAYRVVFTGDRGLSLDRARRIVMQDLERFCHATRSSVIVSPISRVVDSHATCVAEGRREVMSRITRFMNLSTDDITQLTENFDDDE